MQVNRRHSGGPERRAAQRGAAQHVAAAAPYRASRQIYLGHFAWQAGVRLQGQAREVIRGAKRRPAARRMVQGYGANDPPGNSIRSITQISNPHSGQTADASQPRSLPTRKRKAHIYIRSAIEATGRSCACCNNWKCVVKPGRDANRPVRRNLENVNVN